jgi:hypothetical protein
MKLAMVPTCQPDIIKTSCTPGNCLPETSSKVQGTKTKKACQEGVGVQLKRASG